MPRRPKSEEQPDAPGDNSIDQLIEANERETEDALKALAATQGGMPYYPLLLLATRLDISPQLVDDVYDDLCTRFPDGCDRLLVVISSAGGDIDAAYNLALQFRRYGRERLVFAVPRWAKSAATLLVCSGDEILMTPAAELGPLDLRLRRSIRSRTVLSGSLRFTSGLRSISSTVNMRLEIPNWPMPS